MIKRIEFSFHAQPEAEDTINEEAEDGDAEASEEEPYYDSVALDQTGEYVYIDARVAPISNSNRVPLRRPPSLPDSPGNQSNYVNIDYFIQYVVISGGLVWFTLIWHRILIFSAE